MLRELGEDGQVLRRGETLAISLKLQGQWLPLEHVSVNSVGKFRYTLRVSGRAGRLVGRLELLGPPGPVACTPYQWPCCAPGTAECGPCHACSVGG